MKQTPRLLSRAEAVRYFADRKACADFKAFDKILRRCGGQPPREGDEIPTAK